MSTWDEAFADGYEEWSAHMTADIPFYTGLARQAGGHGLIVELAVGNGRVAIPVAQATGQRIIGIDASLVDVAGLEVEALYGGFAGEPFTGDSREYVFVTRKPLS